VQDHHYDQHTHASPIQQVLDQSLCDPQQHVIVFDHVVRHDDSLRGHNLVCLPLFLINSCEQFNHQNINTDWFAKTVTFNFMINKPRPHRELLLAVISDFDLTDYMHTLCWQQVSVSKLGGPYQDLMSKTVIRVPPRQFLVGQERLLDRGLQYGHVTNSQNYQWFLQKQVFESTCVSLITEPAFQEYETIITEKTIMALWGGTMPIWVGGWRIADYMRSLGFDVFDDIVDHSYQDLQDPWERAYQAVSRNLRLLKDADRTRGMIMALMPRFRHNLDLLRHNPFRAEALRVLDQLSVQTREKISQIPEIQRLTCYK
jgi:hypothetical protein